MVNSQAATLTRRNGEGDESEGLVTRGMGLSQHTFLLPDRSRHFVLSSSQHPEMLQDLSHMDRITQLQDEIQQVRCRSELENANVETRDKLLTIMSNTIGYLTSRSNFLQVSEEIPITKQRNPEKFDPPDIFEGAWFCTSSVMTGCIQVSDSKQEGACHGPRNESQTDRISHHFFT